MIAQFFAAAVASCSALQLSHWLMIAGGVLVIAGAVGMRQRRDAEAPPEPGRGEATEVQEQEPNS